MTSVDKADPQRRGGVLAAVAGALRSPRTWRATAHTLVGLPLALAGFVAIGLLVLSWLSAVASLVNEPTGGGVLVTFYAIVSVTGSVPLIWCGIWFGHLQRSRFRAVLGVHIQQPPRQKGGGPVRLIRPFFAPATWRQLFYHLLAPLIAMVGVPLVVACWVLLFPVAPWVARGVARVDEALARKLLGPSNAQDLAQRVDSLARSRADVVAATDAERRRIERDLHDGAQQRLVSLALNLGMARASLVDAPEDARQAIEAAHDEATLALAELREFVRGLHPAVLNDRGLDAALSGIVARLPMPVRLRVDVAERCSPSIEAIAYFVVSEALTNVAKHSRAKRAEVTVERVGDRLRVVVSDDGRGGAHIDDGGGLHGLAQRAAAVDGALDLQSPRGGPTRISVELPCES